MSTWPGFCIPMHLKNKKGGGLFLLVLLVVLSIVLGLTLGSTRVNLWEALREILRGETALSPQARILLYVRLPRVCASLLAGSALAVSGVLIQAVLSNPLASPNVIGVNAGAGFFTFLTMALFPMNRDLLSAGAFLGALTAALLIYAAAAGAGAGKLTIILAGMAVSSIFTAGINAIKTFFPETLYNGSTFLIGGFSGVTMQDLSAAWILILAGLTAASLSFRQIDVLCLGEETALSLGLPVKPVRFWLIFLACVLAGCAVSFSGLISFVGLLVPHIARRLFGTEHRILLPASCLLGAAFVTLCDLCSRILFAPYEIPVGILLSLIGGPFFLALILKQRHRRGGGR